jgi:hypothetical protein
MKHVFLTVAALVALASPAVASTQTVPGIVQINPLDIAVVTTTGTPVTVLGPGEHVAGGFIITANAAGVCISENGPAGVATGYVGTVETVCVAANVSYLLSATGGPVSANSTASGVNLSGYGLRE